VSAASAVPEELAGSVESVESGAPARLAVSGVSGVPAKRAASEVWVALAVPAKLVELAGLAELVVRVRHGSTIHRIARVCRIGMAPLRQSTIAAPARTLLPAILSAARTISAAALVSAAELDLVMQGAAGRAA
jgi:hypothetical protein